MTSPMPTPGAGVSSHPWMPGVEIRKPMRGALHTQLGIPQGANVSIATLAKAIPIPAMMKRRRAIFGAEAKRRGMAGGPVGGI